jgi:ligand-binding sensor domain-containing protein
MSYWEVKDYDIEDGRILIGTTHGLIYIDEDGKEFLLGSGNGLGSDYVNSIGKDKKGNIYICTFGAGIKIWKGLYSESLRRAENNLHFSIWEESLYNHYPE